MHLFQLNTVELKLEMDLYKTCVYVYLIMLPGAIYFSSPGLKLRREDFETSVCTFGQTDADMCLNCKSSLTEKAA